ncbi:UNVERIFIED_CONTAM: hypothetical protein HDU68_004651 [Siphonaria sp. JEL0065]|nr:hypothetical protein HDU68_004651 [Siphonaria sp. JEL0065]
MDINGQATLRRFDDSEQGTFRPAVSSEGYGRPSASTASSARTVKGSLMTNLLGLEFWAKAALLWSLAQLVILLVAEGLVFKAHLVEVDALLNINSTAQGSQILLLVGQTSTSVIGNAQAISIYEGIFMAAQVFQVILSVDAILTSSKMQLMATLAFNLAVFGYSCQQYTQSANLISIDTIGLLHYSMMAGDPINFQFHRTAPFEIAVIALGLVFLVGWTFFSIKLNTLFGWSVFKELGADVDVRKRLTLYHIYMMLLKLDVFFFLSFVVQYVLLVFGDTASLAKTVTIICSPLGVLALLFVAYFAVTRESNVLMTFLLVGLSGGIGYLVDRVIDIWTVNDAGKYKSSKISLTLFTTLTLILSLATFAVAVLNFLNFGKGLMQSLNNRKTPVPTIGRTLELNSFTADGRSYGTGTNPSSGYGTANNTLNNSRRS